MTIKDLCGLTLSCRECEFYGACPSTNEDLCFRQLYDIDQETNERFTKAIIETSRILQEDKNV